MSVRRAASNVPDPAVEISLLAGGEVAFERILRRIDEARTRIYLRCFNWRDDETGGTVAQALLRAAERGVKITILKDRVGMHYEYLEGGNQSFFHKRVGLGVRLQTWFLMAAYRRWGSLRQNPSPHADALLQHPNITVSRDDKRFDHSKLWVFDDQLVILGGMGIGDDSRWANVDFMVELAGAEAAARLADRYEGRAAFDPQRPFDYLLHSFSAAGADDSLREQRLRLIGSARERVTIEMAYLGDRACAEALLAAVERGVLVTLLTSERANVLGDLNLRTCHELLRRTKNAENLRVFLHPRMVHGKAIVVDGLQVDIGSANFTPLSHGAYEEVNLYCQDAVFAQAVEEAIEREILDSQPARHPVPHSPVNAWLERFISHRQAARIRQS